MTVYTETNFKTKKAFRDAVNKGERAVYVYSPGIEPLPENGGVVYVSGPHYPAPHTWYAQVTIDANRMVIKVK